MVDISDNSNSKPVSEIDIQSSQKRQTKVLKILIGIFLFTTIALTSFIVIKYLPKNTKTPVKTSENNTIVETQDNRLSFSQQNLEQPISQYDYALLASPDIISEQRSNSWQGLECVYYNRQSRSSYNFADITKDIKDETLIKGLQVIENYKYKTYTQDETAQQNIEYTDICKDKQSYYVLFLTTGQKDNTQGMSIVREAKAAGGWWGQSNFATISMTGDTKISENIMALSKNIPISDLTKGGFTDTTSRSFAYYACVKFVGKLGDNLYAICGGEGGTDLYKVGLNPLSLTEKSFCWWLMSEGERVCYDTQGKRYYSYK